MKKQLNLNWKKDADEPTAKSINSSEIVKEIAKEIKLKTKQQQLEKPLNKLEDELRKKQLVQKRKKERLFHILYGNVR
jgi:hypothetical protein